MRNLIICLLILVCSINYGQDKVTVKHTNYTSTFSKSLRYPIMVEWWETKAKSECKNRLSRNDRFAPDPKIYSVTDINDDYLIGNRIQKAKELKGFDRGHMCPARVNQCLGSKVQDECFYFSNMTPQYHALNGGDWKTLETLTYNESIAKDSIHIWAGSIGVAMTIGRVSVPKQCWKVVYVKSTDTWSAYLFNNDISRPNGIYDNKVSVSTIENLIKYKFKK